MIFYFQKWWLFNYWSDTTNKSIEMIVNAIMDAFDFRASFAFVTTEVATTFAPLTARAVAALLTDVVLGIEINAELDVVVDVATEFTITSAHKYCVPSKSTDWTWIVAFEPTKLAKYGVKSSWMDWFPICRFLTCTMVVGKVFGLSPSPSLTVTLSITCSTTEINSDCLTDTVVLAVVTLKPPQGPICSDDSLNPRGFGELIRICAFDVANRNKLKNNGTMMIFWVSFQGDNVPMLVTCGVIHTQAASNHWFYSNHQNPP